jgi:hypothetical protein
MWGSEGKNGGAYAKACAPTIAATYFEIDMNVIGYHMRTFLIHNCKNKGLDPIIDNNCLETSATAFAPHFKSSEYTISHTPNFFLSFPAYSSVFSSDIQIFVHLAQCSAYTVSARPYLNRYVTSWRGKCIIRVRCPIPNRVLSLPH